MEIEREGKREREGKSEGEGTRVRQYRFDQGKGRMGGCGGTTRVLALVLVYEEVQTVCSMALML